MTKAGVAGSQRPTEVNQERLLLSACVPTDTKTINFVVSLAKQRAKTALNIREKFIHATKG